MQRLWRWSGMVVLLTALGAGSVLGAGFQLYTEGSAEAVAQGAAISARRDMVSNAWYNPASITDFKEARLMLGGTMVQIRSEYRDKANSLLDAELKDHWNAVPHFFYVQPLPEKTRTTFFLSGTTPFGLMTDWNWGENPAAAGPYVSKKMALETFFLIPGVSHKVTDKLSLAAGVGPVYAKLTSSRNLLLPANALFVGSPAFRSEMELHAEDYGYAYVLGANYQVLDTLTLALKYQSPVDLTLKGDATYDRTTWPLARGNYIEGDVTLPQNIVLGVSTTAVPDWTFGFDLVYTDWSEYDRFNVYFQDNPGAGVGPTYASATKNWRDVFSYRLGAEYRINEVWKWRCGYVFDKSPVPDEYRGPELPCNDRHMFATGVGYDRTCWGVDASYCFLYIEDSDSKQPQLIGRYENGYAHLLSASVWFKF